MEDKKTVAIVGAVHGNESVGMEVIKRLGGAVDGQSVTGVIANKEAFQRGKRFIDQDLNRSFPGNPKGNLEERLAYKLNQEIKRFDYLLDLHSFSCQSEPFAIVTKRTKKHLRLAGALGIRKVVLMSPKLASGTALIDHARCGVSVEAGRHGLESTYNRAISYTKNALRALGFLEGRDQVVEVDFFEVVEVFFKKEGARLRENVANFELVRRGEVITAGKQRKLVAPYDFYPILAREKAYPDILCLAAKSVKIKRR